MKVMVTRMQLEKDLTAAMRAGDDLKRRTLRMVLSAIQRAEVEKGSALDEPAIAAVLQKEIKSRRETIADAGRAGRADLAGEAEAEIGLLESYLPQPLTREQLEEMARVAIREVGATSAREMGQVMKALMPRLQGRAEGALVSQVVRQLLE